MAATLTPHLAPAPSRAGQETMPLVNPITVSMALAVVFLIGLLVIVAVRPTSAHELQGADEGRPAATTPARLAGTVSD